MSTDASVHFYKRNLTLLGGIRVCFSLLFAIPVITLFWNSRGLNLLDIFWLQAIFCLCIVLLEVPTGFLGDRIGRRKTLILASCCAAVGWFIYALAQTFFHFVLVEIVLGAAFSFLSGTDSSLVYESLHASGKEKNYTPVEGRQHALVMWSEGASAIIGALLFAFIGAPLLFAASGAAAVAGIILAFGIVDPPRERYKHPRGSLYGIYKIARYMFLKNKVVRIVVPLMSLASVASMFGVWLYQPLWQQRGLPVWSFGLLWAAMSLVGGLAGHFAPVFEKKFGAAIMLLLPIPVLAGYILTALIPGTAGIVFIYLVPVLRGIANPILSRYVHQETYSDKRATVMSLQSWLFRLMYFVLGPIIGAAAQHHGIRSAFLISALIVAITLIPMSIAAWLQLKKLPPPEGAASMPEPMVDINPY